jgi:hypothetical protein
MEERIARIANSKLMPEDLWPRVYSRMATRESRMEVVAWVAVCKFNCSLVGGFVRDWIVANEVGRPSPTIPPSKWVEFDTASNTVFLLKELVPSDLDCKIPLDCYFDLEKFCDEVKRFNMIPRIHRSERVYRLLFDQFQPTGPFILDLIEPYSYIDVRMPDLDVSNLYVKRDQLNELSQHIDLSKPPYFLDVVQIMKNIKKKEFHVLPSINERIMSRINKMITRGWTQIGSPLIDKPDRIKPKFVITPLLRDFESYQTIENLMQQIAGMSIISIERICNSELDCIYESMKKLIANECIDNNPNEKFLFHGIHTDKITKIITEGFDYGLLKINGRFGKVTNIHFKNTLFNSFIIGNGVYFSDNPQKSHEYTQPTNDNATRVMFYTKVILGREMLLNNVNSALYFPPRDHHSVRSVVCDTSEYIVYRITHALPFLVITYEINSL